MSVDTLRETFHINRISTSDLQDFLTAQTYRPEITQAKNHILSLKNCSLQAVCTKPIQQGKSPKYAEKGLKCIKPKNTNDMLVSIDDIDWIDSSTKDQIQKQKLGYGDIVITRSGSGTIGRASIYCYSEEAYTNDHLFVVRPDKADSHYICSFLNSFHGQRLLEAGVSGSTGQLNLSNEHIKSIPLFRPDEKAQKYIGNKVRQAEQLRAWAKRLERSLDAFIDHFQPEKKEYKKLFSRVPNHLLTNMLTATTYRERYISNQKNLKDSSCTQPISYFLTSVTNGFDERNEIESGLPYIKVADVRAGYIDLKNSPRVRVSALTNASEKQKPKKGDLLLTRKGSFGIAAVVMESASFLCSSEVFSCKPSKPEFMPILSWFLNSEAGNMQFWQFSTGTTMPGINQENLQNILIPDFSDCDIQQFNSIHKNRYEAKKNAELLTDTAKTLIESLIEGQLTEQQLIEAQQALEDGDNSLDQAILSKLSAEGYAIEGATPLFSDVDELYSLLEEAAQAEAEE
ncbi:MULTISPECIES: restriction endonuclease subunit S [unclassified Citrobacter]|uniref:restriction endonuclease subunit S n=1 Tax=unclassified Citrobacter TaxID=2644389 RepID=UPI0010C9A9BE|nr:MULTISPECIES: restriction endonuclease subunit S [unclassified Citrobacter]TKU34736.1 restriction endonuclease subunit S [Citrobacter sp. wls717]TKU79911.1 restriction endonuclease subunit S [Citrobacter sp. wls707]